VRREELLDSDVAEAGVEQRYGQHGRLVLAIRSARQDLYGPVISRPRLASIVTAARLLA
jgi:hypothetical protein